jgi:hypothetical protein
MPEQGYTDVKGYVFLRNEDGSVSMRAENPDGDTVKFSEEEWCKTIAAMSRSGLTDPTESASRLLHRGMLDVKVDIDSESVARVALVRTTGLSRLVERPKFVTP